MIITHFYILDNENKTINPLAKEFSFLGCNTCKHFTSRQTCELPQDYPESYIASDNTGRRCEIGRGCWNYKYNEDGKR